MILSRDKDRFINSIDDLLKEYGKLKKVGRYKSIRGLCIDKSEKIYYKCFNCDKVSSRVFRNYSYFNKNFSFNQNVCSTCKRHLTKINTIDEKGLNTYQKTSLKIKNTCLTRYGVEHPMELNDIKQKIKITKFNKYGNENYNNKEKREKTCLSKYNSTGIPRSEETRKKISEKRLDYYNSNEGKEFLNNLSIQQKERFKNKENHPFYGKKHSKNTIEKNRQSNIETFKEKFNNGTWNSYSRQKFYSIKNDKTIYCRSSWEALFYYMLEHLPNVEYKVEPFCIPYIDNNGKNRNYIPDVLIKYKNINHLIEIKPRYFLNKEINKIKINYATEFVKSSNNIDKFLTISDGEILKYIFKNFSVTDIIKLPNNFLNSLFKECKNISEKMCLKYQL